MSDIQPGQVYQRGHVIVAVLQKRTGPPDDWVFATNTWPLVQRLEWWDVLNFYSELEEKNFYMSGKVQSWTAGMLTDEHSKRIV